MTSPHAILWIDHRTARIIGFNAGVPHEKKLHAHTPHTPGHGSEVRSEHEFFGAVCDGLEGIGKVLVVGPRTGVSDFDRYARKHRPRTAERIVGEQTMGHPTSNQLAATARHFFETLDARAPTSAAS